MSANIPKVPKQNIEYMELKALQIEAAIRNFDEMKELELAALKLDQEKTKVHLEHYEELNEWRAKITRQLRELNDTVKSIQGQLNHYKHRIRAIEKDLEI